MVAKAREALFPLGSVVATPGALAAIQAAGQTCSEFLDKHVSGDWGTVDRGDWRANDLALKEETRVFSAYKLSDGARLWVITEADRSSTCILLPEEY